MEFRVDRTGGETALVPFIDGMSLKDLVELYEAGHGYDPAGEYDGLIPSHFNFGDLRRYHLRAAQAPAERPPALAAP